MSAAEDDVNYIENGSPPTAANAADSHCDGNCRRVDGHQLELGPDAAVPLDAVEHPTPFRARVERDCLFSTNHTAFGKWFGIFDAPTEHPGALHYQLPPSCTGAGDPAARVLISDIDTARRLLAGRHVLFIGDSLIRYQARHLVYALHFGRWLPRFRGSVQAPSPMDEGTYGSWAALHGNITLDIGPESFRCDCFRQTHTVQYETFYYHNHDYDINITFTFHGPGYLGAHYPMGHYFVPLAPPEEMFANRLSTLAWSGFNTSEVVEQIIQGMGRVDEVIVAVGGLWTFKAPPYAPIPERYERGY